MIFIRTDANEQVATGHMMRCKAIAYELDRLGKSVTFLVSDSDSIKLLEGEQFSFRILNTRWDNLGTKEELEIMKAVLLKSRESEKEIPILLVDSYYVDNNYFHTLKSYAKIIFLDDLAEDIYDVDVLINCNVTYEKYDYHNRYKNRNTNLILGPDYVPLRRQFSEIGSEKKDYGIKHMLSMLVICGGSDSENVIYSILDNLRQKELLGSYYYYVVVGAYNPHLNEIIKIAAEFSNVNILYNISDVAEVMEKCDLAITTASTVLYECCAAGLPAVFYTVADNQEPDAEVFSEKYGFIYVGDFRKCREEVLRNIEKATRDLSSDISLRKIMSDNMRKIVDGKGSKRIANLMSRLFEAGSISEESIECDETPTFCKSQSGSGKDALRYR